MAVIVSEPTGRADVVTDACPPASVPEPSTVLPFCKVTVPVGAATPFDTLADTLVINVTGCPKAAADVEDSMLMTVPRIFSSTLTVLLVPFATAMSKAPSALKSPIAAEDPNHPVPNSVG